MRIFPFFLPLFLLCASLDAQRTKINITLTYLQPYCGGARPTEEMQREAETPKPYALKSVMYVSSKGKIDSARTDEQGLLKLKLKKGEYSLYESWRYYLYTPENIPIESFDRNCLKEEWQKPICRITVKKKFAKVVGLNPIIQFCSWNSPCLLQSPAVPE